MQAAFSFFFNTINFRIRTVSWRCAAIPTLEVAARGADCRHTEKAACTPIIFKCRQPSAGNRTPTSPPRVRGQNPPPFRTEIRAARRSPHPNPLPRERGWICCTSEKSSLHISGNIQSESAGCFFTAEKPHRPKFAGTPIPPNQARYAFAAAAHTPNPVHRQHSASPRLFQ